MLLEDTLSDLLMIKLQVGGYSLYLWANELCEGLPHRQCRPRAHRIGVLPRDDTACKSRRELLLPGPVHSHTDEESQLSLYSLLFVTSPSRLSCSLGGWKERWGMRKSHSLQHRAQHRGSLERSGKQGLRSPGQSKIQGSMKTQQYNKVQGLTPCK